MYNLMIICTCVQSHVFRVLARAALVCSVERYLENRDGLPRPSGLQSAGITPKAVSQANEEKLDLSWKQGARE